MKNIYKYLMIVMCSIAILSCKKEEALNVDLKSLNPDYPTSNTPLDQWLTANFLDKYNIEVIYRYNRYYHDNAANVIPGKLESVQPTMQIVLDGFIEPYLKVAGEKFTKKYMPKEWVLFGSYSYESSSATGVAGTAAAGRRITLYGLNDYQPLPAGQGYAWDRHRIMHHEFGHILNQIIPIPIDFENISKGLYKQPYNNTSAADAKANGFITAYASGQASEDYAESISYPLINGQAWYDNYANTSTPEGKARLIQKNLNVITYFNNLGVNYKELQREVQKYMKEKLNRNEAKFTYWFGQKLWSSMMVNMDTEMYLKYGRSDKFKALYDATRTGVAAVGNANRVLNFIRFEFPTATTMNVNINYTNTAGSIFDAKYAFNVSVDQTSGEIKFTEGTPGGTDGVWGNANTIKTASVALTQFLTSNTFLGDWLPIAIDADNYMKFGGFIVKGDASNYFYGPLTY